MRLVRHFEPECPQLGCKVVKVEGKWDSDYRIEYADGWYFTVSYDPRCVEITRIWLWVVSEWI